MPITPTSDELTVLEARRAAHTARSAWLAAVEDAEEAELEARRLRLLSKAATETWRRLADSEE